MTSSWITTIKRTAATVFTAAAVLVSGCSSPETSDMTSLNSYKYEQELNIIDDNFRNYYQIFVGSFCDSNGDGIGDPERYHFKAGLYPGHGLQRDLAHADNALALLS